MAVIFNATTSQGMLVTPDNSGQIQFQSNGVNLPSPFTVAPAFSSYQTNGNANQSISSDVWTKAKIDTKEFDTNSNFDTTNNRFLPTVAGYYQINGCLLLQNAATCPIKIVGIYKNGSLYKQGTQIYFNGNYYIAADTFTVSSLVYLNGSSDYVELYAYISSTAANIGRGSVNSWFNGCLVRAA
jgi:hypothetical protein